MANKNTRRIRQAVAREAKAVFGNKRDGLIVISENLRRNSRMVVRRNFGDTVRGGMTLTNHEPGDPHRSMRPKNHKYMEVYVKAKIRLDGQQKPTSETPAEGFAFDNTVIHV